MAVDWLDVLGWTEEQVQDVRVTGYGYFRQGHYAHAIVFFEALISLNPESVYDLEMLGALYLQKGDYKRAIETLDRAMSLAPDHQESRLNKAKAHLSLGEREEGLGLAQELSRSPNHRVRNLATALVMAYQ